MERFSKLFCYPSKSKESDSARSRHSISNKSIMESEMGFETSLNHNDQTLCAICLEFINYRSSINEVAKSNICSDPAHFSRVIHCECLRSFISSKISSAIPGTCSIITCPYEGHIKGPKVLRYSVWKEIVDEELLSTYNNQASSLLSILCSGCHTVKSLATDEDNIAGRGDRLNDLERQNSIPAENLACLIDRYEDGKISVEEFYLLLIESMPKIVTSSDLAAWSIFKSVLSFIQNPERRSNLHLRYLRDRPKIKTPCCNKDHCFRCKTKDFHTGTSCEENLMALDSTIVSCPNCSISLARGDGCNNIICVCGKSFAWSQERENVDRAIAFAQSFPENTGYYCCMVLCNKIFGNADHARAWRQRHQVESNDAFTNMWCSTFPHCPAQAAATFPSNSSTEGLRLARDVYQRLHPQEIAACEKANKIAKEALFLSFCHSDAPEDMARLLMSKHFTNHELLLPGCKDSINNWIASHKSSYENAQIRQEMKSGLQFLFLHGHEKIDRSASPTSKVPSPKAWNRLISNTSLTYSNDYKSVQRVGSVSCYPAAFADLIGPISSLTISLDQAPRGPNWLTFGIAKRGHMTNSSSDGVGRTAMTWGICDDRSSAINHQATIYSSGQSLTHCRKLKEGDLLKVLVNTKENWMEIRLNQFEFRYRVNVPFDEHFSQYHFAATFANDHMVTIIDDGYNNAKLASLNETHLEMYMNMRKILRKIMSDTMLTDLNVENEDEYCRKWYELTEGNPLAVFEAMKLPLETILSMKIEDSDDKNKLLHSKSDNTMALTWWKIFYSLVWHRVYRRKKDEEDIMDLASRFLAENKESSPMIAAGILFAVDAFDNNTVRKAKAFMKIFPDEMNDWYIWNAMLPEPLIDCSRFVEGCICLPRHIKTCPYT